MVDGSSASSAPADWHTDPTGRHQYRYWDGTTWTDHVSDNGQVSVDPLRATNGGGSARLRSLLLQFPALSPAITKAQVIALFGKPDGETACDDGDTCLQWFLGDCYFGGYWSPSGSFTSGSVLDPTVSDKQVRIDRYLAAVRG